MGWWGSIGKKVPKVLNVVGYLLVFWGEEEPKGGLLLVRGGGDDGTLEKLKRGSRKTVCRERGESLKPGDKLPVRGKEKPEKRKSTIKAIVWACFFTGGNRDKRPPVEKGAFHFLSAQEK